MLELTSRCIDLTGQVFGSITLLRPSSYNKAGEVVWEGQCVCGNWVYKSGPQLKAAVKKSDDVRSPSCGCFQKEFASKQAVKRFTTHGMATNTGVHPVYKLYHKIRSRCHNPSDTNYHLYGAKGVTLCDEWLGHPDVFMHWCLANGWKPGLQLDKDILCDALGISPKVYSPATCQFITQHENLIKSASRSTYGTNKNIKLSEQDLIDMRALYQQGTTKAEIARRFGVSKTHVSRLIPTL